MEGKKLRGVYSTESPLTTAKGVAGLGGSSRRLWVIWDNDEDTMLAQPLNQNLIPSGEPRTIPLKDFLEQYHKEPDYAIDQTSPEFNSIWKAPAAEPPAAPPEPPAKAPSPVPEDEPLELTDPLPAAPAAPSAPQEPRRQADVLDAPIKEIITNMQADFADGLEHLKAGRIEKAVELFEYLAEMKADFAPEHKHVFNDFGIDLRKNKVFDLAIKHYAKALNLSPSDENLYHNIARVHYEKGDMDQALKHLEKSLEINPELRESELFWDYIIKKRRRTAKKKYTMDM